MPAKSFVAIGAGPGYTDIPCTIGANFVRITEVAITPGEMLAKFPNDAAGAYATAVTLQPSTTRAVIELNGHGVDGIIARPAGYNASGVPAAAELYCRLVRVDNSATTVMVEEFERSFSGIPG